MTHDELLAKIDTLNYLGRVGYISSIWNAFRAVVERHFPYREDDWQEGYFECAECTGDLAIEYPCNTIQDIAKELK